jgi:hypothetical protein
MSPPTCFGDAGGHAFGRSGGGRYRRCLFRFIVASSRSLALSSLGLFLFVSLLLVFFSSGRALVVVRNVVVVGNVADAAADEGNLTEKSACGFNL